MNKSKIFMYISMIILFVSVMGSIGSFAFFGWASEEEATIDVAIAGGTGECSLKYDNNILIEPSNTRNGGRIIKLNTKQEVGSRAIISWSMYIKEIEGLQDASFNYEMVNTSTGVSYGSGTFESVNSGDTITFTNDTEILGFGTDYEFTLYLWIDGNFGNYQIDMADKTLDFNIKCNMTSVEEGTISNPSQTLIERITNLYTEYSETTPVNFADGTGMNYYAPTVSLMNDGLDSTGTETNDMYKGNIRYYGANPNNYIYFNCDDYSDTSTCEIWRIVGIVDGKVKIIREESIGILALDAPNNIGADSENINNWEKASLQMFLNGKYYNRVETEKLTYYSGEDGSTETELNLVEIGITEATRNNNLISESTWYLGGVYSFSNMYANDIYTIERTNEPGTTIYGSNPYTVDANIGLIYASDYSYATDLNKCTVDMKLYYTVDNCNGTNWLLNTLLNNNKKLLLITPGTDGKRICTVYNGQLGWGTEPSNNTPFRTHPTLYLDQSIVIAGGTGSSDNPYKIYVEEEVTSTNLIQHITNLYTSSNPVEVNDSIEWNNNLWDITYYHSYLDTENTWGIMNDGLDNIGNETGDINTGNIRYFGINPNNYIYFNCSDYSNQTESTCEKWRIVGIIDGKVKIMNSQTIGKYSWDSAHNQYWPNASLKNILNDGGDYFVSLQTKNSETIDLISSSLWYDTETVYPEGLLNHAYSYERGLSTWSGDIALLNITDYGYAADVKKCGFLLEEYEACSTYNWMKQSVTDNGSESGWLLAVDGRNLEQPTAFVIDSSGVFSTMDVSISGVVVPNLYLDPNLNVNTSVGDGTESNPYRLIVNLKK